MKTIKKFLFAIVLFLSSLCFGQNSCFSIKSPNSTMETIEIEIDSFFYSSGSVCSITNYPISSLSVVR